MKTLYITQGISCSGKTTWAEAKASTDFDNGINTVNINRDYIRFTLVKPGSNWKTYKATRENETKVTELAIAEALEAVANGSNIIISDTNLNTKYLSYWQSFASAHNYKCEIVDFEVTIEEAWKRDSLRSNGVGHSVIYQQMQRYRKLNYQMFIPQPNLPSALIVDLDGTVADKGTRHAFAWMEVGNDAPRSLIITMVLAVAKEHNAQILFTSGRDNICRDLSISWIEKHIGIKKEDVKLFMRPNDDYRKDTLVKEEIFWRDINPHYNVIGAFDDRPCIVRLWNLIGIPNVIAVANPYVEF